MNRNATGESIPGTKEWDRAVAEFVPLLNVGQELRLRYTDTSLLHSYLKATIGSTRIARRTGR